MSVDYVVKSYMKENRNKALKHHIPTIRQKELLPSLKPMDTSNMVFQALRDENPKKRGFIRAMIAAALKSTTCEETDIRGYEYFCCLTGKLITDGVAITIPGFTKYFSKEGYATLREYLSMDDFKIRQMRQDTEFRQGNVIVK